MQQSRAVESTTGTMSYQRRVNDMTGRHRTAQWSNTQRLHPYHDSRLTNLTTSTAPPTSWSAVLTPDDLESAICQSETTTHSGRPDPLRLTDYPSEDVEVIEFARRRAVMDMIMTRGWCINTTRKQRQSMHRYAREIVNEAKVSLDHPGLEITSSVTTLVIQALPSCRSKLIESTESVCTPFYRDSLEPQEKLSAKGRIQYMMERRAVIYNSSEQHTYFLHGHKNGRLVLFSHDGLEAAHHQYWYLNENSPLFDDDMREMLTTTTCPMLAMSGVSVMCFVDRYAEGRLSMSGDVIKFKGDQYADKYRTLNLSMEAAFNSNLHREPMTLYFQYLHDKGMRLLSDKLGLTSPALIYLPTSPDELTQPSAAANTTTSHNTASHNIALPFHISPQFQQTTAAANTTTSHNTASHNIAPPFHISPQLQQTSPFATWSSTAHYVQDSDSASAVHQSGQALYSGVECSAYVQSDMHTQFAQQSYPHFSANSMHDLSSETPQGSFWSESSEDPQGTFWSESDVRSNAY